MKRLLSILLFTLHQTAWNPDKHRASERWRVAGHSSPLFTTLHRINAEPLTYAREYCWAATYHEAWSSLMTSAGLQWWLKQGVRNDLGASKNTGWREVKSGEECIVTLHPCKPLIYSWLCRICEEWRVFLKVALYSSNAAKLLRKMWGFWQKLLRKMWWIAENSFGKCDFSYVILWLWAFFSERGKKVHKWALRTSFLPYERNEDSKMLNIPLYMLFVLGKELETES